MAVSRDVIGLTLNRTNYAAMATVVNSSDAIGGKIRVRSLLGTIRPGIGLFRPMDAGTTGRALIELVAAGDIVMLESGGAERRAPPTLTTIAAQAVSGIGKGGSTLCDRCQGQVPANARSRCISHGFLPRTNELTASAAVIVLGTVNPVGVTGSLAVLRLRFSKPSVLTYGCDVNVRARASRFR